MVPEQCDRQSKLAAVSHRSRTARQSSTWERGKIGRRRRIHTVIGENMIFFKRQEDRQNGEYETRKKSRGQIEKTFRPGASSVVERALSTTDEAPGRNVFSICPLLFFLVSYSPFCLSSCLLKKYPH